MRFGEKLRKAMQNKGINQAQLKCLTGIGASSISQYLSGKNEPTKDRQRDIAVSLGLDEDYFFRDMIEAIPPIRTQAGKKRIQTLSVKDASKLMGKGVVTVEKGLQQGIFPWGYAIKTGTNRKTGKTTWSYFINAARFAEHERIELDK